MIDWKRNETKRNIAERRPWKYVLSSSTRHTPMYEFNLYKNFMLSLHYVACIHPRLPLSTTLNNFHIRGIYKFYRGLNMKWHKNRLPVANFSQLLSYVELFNTVWNQLNISPLANLWRNNGDSKPMCYEGITSVHPKYIIETRCDSQKPWYNRKKNWIIIEGWLT